MGRRPRMLERKTDQELGLVLDRPERDGRRAFKDVVVPTRIADFRREFDELEVEHQPRAHGQALRTAAIQARHVADVAEDIAARDIRAQYLARETVLEQQRELPDHVVKVEDVLRCVVSMLSNELPGDIHASFDDLTVNDLRAAWVELQDLRVMRHKILELCGNTAQ